LGTGQGVMYASRVVKIECLRVKFEWLKGQRSVQHPKDINGCNPRECTSTDALQGNVPRLAKHEDFDTIFEGCGSQFGEERACTGTRLET